MHLRVCSAVRVSRYPYSSYPLTAAKHRQGITRCASFNIVLVPGDKRGPSLATGVRERCGDGVSISCKMRPAPTYFHGFDWSARHAAVQRFTLAAGGAGAILAQEVGKNGLAAGLCESRGRRSPRRTMMRRASQRTRAFFEAQAVPDSTSQS